MLGVHVTLAWLTGKLKFMEPEAQRAQGHKADTEGIKKPNKGRGRDMDKRNAAGRAR